MKFAFFASNCVPIHAKSLEERPLGGTETGIIRLAEALYQLGHEVTVFTPHENPSESLPLYRPLAAVQSHPAVDVFISVRDWIPLFYKIEATYRFLWTGDSYDELANFGIGDQRIQSRFNKVLCVSDWQADRLSKTSGMARELAFNLGNGVHLEYFEEDLPRTRKRLIYSSTPHRGLEFIPFYYPELKKAHPDLEIHIFSGYEVYNQENPNFETLRKQLLDLPDCHVHGNILQADLAKEFLKSAILFYPCHFEETSCITAMEAMAAGCVPLTHNLGALSETIAEAGVLIDGRPNEPSSIASFLRAADQLLKDDAYFERLSNKSKERAKGLSWTSRAQKLLDLISEVDAKKK